MKLKRSDNMDDIEKLKSDYKEFAKEVLKDSILIDELTKKEIRNWKILVLITGVLGFIIGILYALAFLR